MSRVIEKINADYKNTLDFHFQGVETIEACQQNFEEDLIRRGCYLYGEHLIPMHIKPHFVDGSHISYVKKTSEILISAIERLIGIYFEAPDLRNEFLLSEFETELVAHDPGFSRIIHFARNDVVWDGSEPYFLELNCDSPGGPMYTDIQQEVVMSSTSYQAIASRWELRTYRFMDKLENILLAAYREFCEINKLPQKPTPFIAIVAGRKSRTLPEFHLIAEWFRNKGYAACFQDPRDLTTDKMNNLLTDEGDRIDLVYRRGRLEHWTWNIDEIKPLLKAYRAGKICVVNSPRSILGAKKHIFSLLQDKRFQHLFTESELQVIRKHVPWTRLMKQVVTKDQRGKDVELFDHVRRNKDALVLKPIDKHGGEDVCIGMSVDQSTWEDRIETTTRNQYVVQKYVNIPKEEFPVIKKSLKWTQQLISENYFVFDGIFAGGYARTSHNQVINIVEGGGLATIVMVIDKK